MKDPISDALGISQYNYPTKPEKRDIRRSANEKKRVMNEVDIKEKQVIDLRRQGMSFRQIADILDYSGPGAVHNVYKRVMERDYELLAEAAHALRIEQMEQLDEQLHQLLERQKLDPDNLNVVDRILKVMERKSKLIGLDAAIKTEAKVNMAMTHEEILDLLDQENAD